jgi:hypothetical protein
MCSGIAVAVRRVFDNFHLRPTSDVECLKFALDGLHFSAVVVRCCVEFVLAAASGQSVRANSPREVDGNDSKESGGR